MGVSLALVVAAAPVEIIPAQFHGAKQPQVARSPNGELGVVFGKENSVYLVRSGDGGKTYSEPQLVGGVGKLALGMRRGPRLAFTENSLAVTAVSHADGNLYCWILEGKTTWNRSQVNDSPDCAREGLHAMASDARKKVFVAWLDLRAQKTELWGALSTDGGKNFGKNFRIYQSPDGHICECCHPSVIFTPSGEVVAMWRNWLGGSRDMFWASSRDGKNFRPAEKLGTESWPLNACPMDGGALATTANGKTISIWRRDQKIFSASDGQAEMLVSEQGTQPVAAAGKDKTYFICQQGNKLMLKIQPGSAPAKVLAEKAAYPAISPALPPRGPVVVWESSANETKSIFAEVLE